MGATQHNEPAFGSVAPLISATAREGFVGIMKSFLHKVELCDGQPDLLGFRKQDIRCPVCVREIQVKKREDYFNSWDRMGLGYIGPSCFSKTIGEESE